MTVDKTTVKAELEILGATLLLVEEAEALPERLRCYSSWWWLRSPGCSSRRAAIVCGDGSVVSSGYGVHNFFNNVRPALKINLESSDFAIGDRFIYNGVEFEIRTKNLAFCLSDIGCTFFDDKSNNYETSHIKKRVDNWFEGGKE